jgi:hypothetical protein
MGRERRFKAASRTANAEALRLDAKMRKAYKCPRWRQAIAWLAPGFARRHKERWEERHRAALKTARDKTRRGIAEGKIK